MQNQLNESVEGVAPADPARLLLFAPAVFAVHVLEEAPGFVVWFNRTVHPGITRELFLTVNFAAFLITVAVTVFAATAKHSASALLALARLSFLMFANAVFHITGTIVRGN